MPERRVDHHLLTRTRIFDFQNSLPAFFTVVPCILRAADTEPRLGGQAVIEGVMIRDPTGWAVAVRAPDGSIKKRLERRPSFQSRHRWTRVPILRGSITLIESMALGFKALSWSAEVFAAQDTLDNKGHSSRSDTSFREPTNKSSPSSGEASTGSETGSGAVSVLAAVVFAITLFVVVPATISRLLLAKAISGALAISVSEGILRVGILLGYILAVSRIPEVRRVFEYHGAEHQTIAAFEEKDPLVFERISAHSTKHPRCGTSFLLTVMIVTIAVFSVIRETLPFSLQIAARILLLPLVAGISYELTKLGWAYRQSLPAKLLMLPGLALQGITTRPPDASQVEVAVVSLKTLLGENIENTVSPDDWRAANNRGASKKEAIPNLESARSQE